MLSVERLEKTYENGVAQKVLKGIDLEVRDGEYVALTGKSGSGKSTLLYQIGLLDYPTAGRVRYDGVDMATLTSVERSAIRLQQLGFVFQDYALLPELTAEENVAVPLLMRGWNMKEALKAAETALGRVGMGHRFGNPPSKLSGGEQQRVSVARALAGKPRLLLADEPTANLDSDNGRTVMELFEDLNAAGQTIILVTHEEEYARLAQRHVVLSDGMIVKDDRRG